MKQICGLATEWPCQLPDLKHRIQLFTIFIIFILLRLFYIYFTFLLISEFTNIFIGIQ